MYNTELAEKIAKEIMNFIAESSLLIHVYISPDSKRRITDQMEEIVLKDLNAHYQTQSVTVNLEPTDGHGLDFPAS